jgi:hypothetical protein
VGTAVVVMIFTFGAEVIGAVGFSSALHRLQENLHFSLTYGLRQ